MIIVENTDDSKLASCPPSDYACQCDMRKRIEIQHCFQQSQDIDIQKEGKAYEVFWSATPESLPVGVIEIVLLKHGNLNFLVYLENVAMHLDQSVLEMDRTE
ncbi:9739_t:CDS:2, partial [Entrophospora sp. SA101]